MTESIKRKRSFWKEAVGLLGSRSCAKRLVQQRVAANGPLRGPPLNRSVSPQSNHMGGKMKILSRLFGTPDYDSLSLCELVFLTVDKPGRDVNAALFKRLVTSAVL